MVLLVAGALGLVLLIRRYGRVGALAPVGLVLGGRRHRHPGSGGLRPGEIVAGNFEQMPYFVIPAPAMLVAGALPGVGGAAVPGAAHLGLILLLWAAPTR